MLQVFFSTKGGVGTSVVAAATAVAYAKSSSVLVIDLAGDQPAVFGGPEPSGLGIDDWLVSDAEPDALSRLEVAATEQISVLSGSPTGPSNTTELGPRLELFAAWVAVQSRPIVVDIGTGRGLVVDHLASYSTSRVLVTRSCYLALRRVRAQAISPTACVMIAEPGRALGRRDVEAVVGIDDVTVLAWDPAVARAVDAGLLATRLPRQLRKRAEHLAT